MNIITTTDLLPNHMEYFVITNIPLRRVFSMEGSSEGRYTVNLKKFSSTFPKTAKRLSYWAKRYVVFSSSEQYYLLVKYGEDVGIINNNGDMLFGIYCSTAQEAENITKDIERINDTNVFEVHYSHNMAAFNAIIDAYGDRAEAAVYADYDVNTIKIIANGRSPNAIKDILGAGEDYSRYGEVVVYVDIDEDTPSLKYKLDCLRLVGSFRIQLMFGREANDCLIVENVKRILL